MSLKELKLEDFEKFASTERGLFIIKFYSDTCMPCKTVQRPAIQQVQQTLGDNVQIIEVDASERMDLASEWGVMSVPTTFILDKNGQPRQINHGVARAEKLLAQLKD